MSPPSLRVHACSHYILGSMPWNRWWAREHNRVFVKLCQLVFPEPSQRVAASPIESWPINTRLVTGSIQIGFKFHPANGCKLDDDSNGRTYVSGGLKPPTYTRQSLGTRAILWISVCNITVHPIAGGTVNSFDVPMFVRYSSYSK